MSRVRSETIRSSFRLPTDRQPEMEITQALWFIPDEALERDPIEWLESLAQKEGYRNLEEALWKIHTPTWKAIAITHQGNELRKPPGSTTEILQHAAVLSRIGNHLYDPARPPVISERRLTRIVELTEFFNQSFYELD